MLLKLSGVYRVNPEIEDSGGRLWTSRHNRVTTLTPESGTKEKETGQYTRGLP